MGEFKINEPYYVSTYDPMSRTIRGVSGNRPWPSTSEAEFSSDKIYSQQDLESFVGLTVSLPSLGLLTENTAGLALKV